GISLEGDRRLAHDRRVYGGNIACIAALCCPLADVLLTHLIHHSRGSNRLHGIRLEPFSTPPHRANLSRTRNAGLRVNRVALTVRRTLPVYPDKQTRLE